MLKTVTNSINASQIQTPIALPGDVTLSTGNLVIGTSGKGIDFSATPGTGTSELLADYEEGTWTPIATAQTGSITSYTSSGTYTKVGRQVTLIGIIEITNSGTGTNGLKLTGLPFAYANQIILSGREVSISGKGLTGSGLSTGLIVSYADTLSVLATGSTLNFTITYFV